ncbi:hypothetical protein BY996DRAFT_6520589 [Phakopsora pachyrhizi]|uniref:Uncharacterized protein n=1 Tax=Phakopsora pachyrhizi TaxID=170000 RepID=A0AAV0B4D2_PHAPC|nr:hypothetical protein BY996DRAFT_6524873 [Phakopsora pachyrhizi]KAI8451048.1 hypothetical protein BY996DRAFT_6520589 [Phakopsora pachyrhizi]CAH7676763.1 hypothetical protein PPACK8108_LOCUS11859 [Phakopsora pachyrhizi]CAH7684150.1 hypothetical protein PPACK8108_LOCUS18184 [Phakopsora pachyrhizi]
MSLGSASDVIGAVADPDNDWSFARFLMSMISREEMISWMVHLRNDGKLVSEMIDMFQWMLQSRGKRDGGRW